MTGRGGALTIAALNALPDADAAMLLEGCCGSREWVRRMLARRPFHSREALLTAATEVWFALAPDDWHEAFDHHPRIGERDAAVRQSTRSAAWSGDEQRAVSTANPWLQSELARANREYEQKFGHIYLVSASGKAADELLAILRARLANDAASELRVAAAEQAKITALRLVRLTEADVPRQGVE